MEAKHGGKQRSVKVSQDPKLLRTFRDVLGASPSELRAREQAVPHELKRVPACFVSAAQRPGLTIAVSEKRRQNRSPTNGAEGMEVP
jgi:hypothetical protein